MSFYDQPATASFEVILACLWLVAGVVFWMGVSYVSGAGADRDADVLFVFLGPFALVVLPYVYLRRFWKETAADLELALQVRQPIAELGELALGEYKARLAVLQHGYQCHDCSQIFSGEKCPRYHRLNTEYQVAAYSLDERGRLLSGEKQESLNLGPIPTVTDEEITH